MNRALHYTPHKSFKLPPDGANFFQQMAEILFPGQTFAFIIIRCCLLVLVCKAIGSSPVAVCLGKSRKQLNCLGVVGNGLFIVAL